MPDISCKLKCQNGGKCVLGEKPTDQVGYGDFVTYRPSDIDHMHCECPDGFDGEVCELHRTPCGDNFCFHGGTCLERVVNGEVVHHCDCRSASTADADYAGRFCQFRAVNYCTKTDGPNGKLFCTNGGQCQDEPHKGCICNDDFVGFSCEYVKNGFNSSTFLAGEMEAGTTEKEKTDHYSPGKSEPGTDEGKTEKEKTDYYTPADPKELHNCVLKCQNEGVCRYGVKDSGILENITSNAAHLSQNLSSQGFMYCVCPTGFTGVLCEEKVTMCREGTHPCLHGSECEGNEKACDCSTVTSNASDIGVFVGAHCEHPVDENDVCTFQVPGPAQPLLFCANGGVCKSKVNFDQP